MPKGLNHRQNQSSFQAARDECLIIFAKAPFEGKVKTRLAADIGSEAATGLYRAFVEDLLFTLSHTGYPIQIHYWPPDAGIEMTTWLGADYEFLPQSGGDLGERMASAFASAFSKNAKQAVLVGTDFPDLPSLIIHDAFNALSTHDAVIGPSNDGGYFLIGFTRHGFLPDVFQGIQWGTPSVFSETVKIFKKKQHAVHILPEWWDIDTHGDLLEFIYRQKKSIGSKAPRTTRLINMLGLANEGGG